MNKEQEVKNYFQTYELIPWELWELLGENGRNLISGRVVHAHNLLRAELGKSMTCNTKGKGGRNASGLRTPAMSFYRVGSQHSGNHNQSIDGNKCTAMDTVGDWDPRELHAIILKNPEKYHMVRFIEIDISWSHIDCRNDTAELELWSPSRGFVSRQQYIKELKENGFW